MRVSYVALQAKLDLIIRYCGKVSLSVADTSVYISNLTPAYASPIVV